MSGGSFNYAYRRTQDFAEQLGSEIEDSEQAFSADTIAKLAEIQRRCEITARLMREVEWLFSYDTGEDDFAENVAEIEAVEKAERGVN